MTEASTSAAHERGVASTGVVEVQATKYSDGIPDPVPAWVRPLPFLYQSMGVETRFTNRLDPEPRSRRVFQSHRPKTLAEWAASTPPTPTGGTKRAAESAATYTVATTLRGRLQSMPPLAEAGLWPAQIRAVRNLEVSLREDRPRSLIQMATGSGTQAA